jgi:hypothetical protein
MDLNSFDYRVGSEIAATPRLTLSTEILGVVRPHASGLFRSDLLGNQRLVGRSEIDGTFGGKWKLAGDRAVVFNLLFPLNTAGIRPTYVITAGVQSTL